MFSGFGSYFTTLVGGQSEAAKREKNLELLRVGTQQISYQLSEVNFDHLRRKRAFIKGINLQLSEEYDKEVLLGFGDLPDILPLKPHDAFSSLDYNNLMKTTATPEEQKSATPGANSQLFNYDTDDSAAKQKLLERFDLIRKRKIKMTQPDGKPVAIIYNKYISGDKSGEIESVLYQKDVMHEIIVCENNLDPFNKAFDLSIDNYSALIAVGGDGTFNQMVNGMLARPDKKQIPVGLIPTGQSNDTARSLGIHVGGLLHSLETIAKGETITIDTTRVLLDHDSENSVPYGVDRLQFCRYMISNSTLSMPAKIANGAETWKGFCGGSSYSIATYLQAFSCGFVQDTYSLTIDDVAYNQGGQLNTALMSVNNGKYANGGMILNPFAAMNDGLIDITWISDPSYSGTFGVTGIFSDARAGAGIQAYRGHSQYVRGRKIRIEVPQPEP